MVDFHVDRPTIELHILEGFDSAAIPFFSAFQDLAVAEPIFCGFLGTRMPALDWPVPTVLSTLILNYLRIFLSLNKQRQWYLQHRGILFNSFPMGAQLTDFGPQW